MQLPYSDKIEIQYLNRLFDNTSESYKFFWFQSILKRVIRGEQIITFSDLVNDMIAEAWYMVIAYHLNLGPSDAIEKAVLQLHAISPLRANEKKEIIIECLKRSNDPLLMKWKRNLIQNVPYRLQSPFLSYKTGDWNHGTKVLAENINQYKDRLIYYFLKIDGMNTQIIVDTDWCAYINKHQEILHGWLNYNLILYLQKRNPAVPGISDKLSPPTERKLKKVIHFWEHINEIHPVTEIYSNALITRQEMSIDHFVPWSYIANDEFWNLHPTTKSMNSAKSNHLPDWNHYFSPLSQLEYQAYTTIWTNDTIHNEFDVLAKEHLNNPDIKERVYHPEQTLNEFQKSLESVIKPIYQSAQNCGFTEWIYNPERNTNHV